MLAMPINYVRNCSFLRLTII